MEAHGERIYSSYSFTTSALDGDQWWASRPGRALPQGKGFPVRNRQATRWVPEPVWSQKLKEKSSLPLPGIEPHSSSLSGTILTVNLLPPSYYLTVWVFPLFVWRQQRWIYPRKVSYFQGYHIQKGMYTYSRNCIIINSPIFQVVQDNLATMFRLSRSNLELRHNNLYCNIYYSSRLIF
jgi:hypothetical protein